MLVLFYLVTVVVILSGYMLGRIMVTLFVDNCFSGGIGGSADRFVTAHLCFLNILGPRVLVICSEIERSTHACGRLLGPPSPITFSQVS